MATVCAVIASTHHPFYYRASTATGAHRPPFADEWVSKILAFRETLTQGFQKEYALRLTRFEMPYPDIAT